MEQMENNSPKQENQEATNQGGDKGQTAKQQNRRDKNRKRLVLFVVFCVLFFLMIGFAWYYYMTHRDPVTDQRDVMSPYYLYLLDASGQDYLNLTVGNLHPGETKQVVIGVSNKDPKGEELSYTIGKESTFNYQLELAYTKNLPLIYRVYELEAISKAEAEADDTSITIEEPDENGVNQTVGYWKKKSVSTGVDTLFPAMQPETEAATAANNGEMYGELSQVVNLGQYDVYTKAADNTTDLMLNTTISGNDVHFDLDYYLIELDWESGVNFNDYTKETDLIYVVVNALQLKPVESD